MVKKFTLFSAKRLNWVKSIRFKLIGHGTRLTVLLPATPAQLASAIFIVILKQDPFCRFKKATSLAII
jgi:hypothetical protein